MPNTRRIINLFDGYTIKLFNKNNFSEKCLLIEKIINNLHKVKIFNFSEGYTGILWALTIESKKNDNFLEDILLQFDENILKFTIGSFNVKDYDFLYGGIGGVLYFIERNNINSLKSILKVVNEVATSKVNVKLFYDYSLSSVNDKYINLSLAHGMASFIAICNIAIKENVLIDEFKRLLSNLFQYYMEIFKKQQIDCFFPNFMKNNKPFEYQKRLAWCWGDLGVLYQMLIASKILKKETEYLQITEALKVLAKYNFNDAAIYDACVCHGSSGIAYIFHKIYQITSIEMFKNTRDFWLKETERILKEQNNKFYNPEIEKWVENITFLDGMAGVELVLKTISGDIEPSWDRTLLLG